MQIPIKLVSPEEVEILRACTPVAWLGIREACFATTQSRLHCYCCFHLLCEGNLAECRNDGKKGVEIKLTPMGEQLYYHVKSQIDNTRH